MKYKFRVQTCIMAAGLLAAAYAEACYYQKTTSKCFLSGETVDTVYWADNTTGSVIATADWTMNSVTTTPNAANGYANYTLPPQARGYIWCAGPAKITDRSGHVNSLNYWESGSAGSGANQPDAPPTGETWGNQDTTSGTCT